MFMTPWTFEVTQRPAVVSAERMDGLLYVSVGDKHNDYAACRSNSDSGEILYSPISTNHARPITSFSIPLQRWGGGGLPRICLHPFALNHLIVTRQLPARLVWDVVRLIDETKSYTTELTLACPLLDMLKVRKAMLTFCSVFDAEVRVFEH